MNGNNSIQHNIMYIYTVYIYIYIYVHLKLCGGDSSGGGKIW